MALKHSTIKAGSIRPFPSF